MLFGKSDGLGEGHATALKQCERSDCVFALCRGERKMLLPVFLCAVVLFLRPRLGCLKGRKLFELASPCQSSGHRDAVGEATVGAGIPINYFPNANAGAGRVLPAAKLIFAGLCHSLPTFAAGCSQSHPL